MVCKRYSAQYKMNLVEEYLKLKEKDNKLSIAKYAREHDISDSTFNDWIIKYKRQGTGFCNITAEILKLDNAEIVDNSNENLMVRKVFDTSNLISTNIVRMQYNGATVEFDESLLERALKVLQSW